MSGLKSTFARARMIVVAGSGPCGLVDAIRRMGIADVCRFERLEDAQARCDDGAADACIVILPRSVPDEMPSLTAQAPAPGQGRVPALLFAEAVTPYIRRAARHAGYEAAIPFGLPPRMLYRCIGALLQASRRSKTSRSGLPGAARQPAIRLGIRIRASGLDSGGSGKPRLQ